MPQRVLAGLVAFPLARAEFQLNAPGQSGPKQTFLYGSHRFAARVCDSSPAREMRARADLVWTLDPLPPGDSSPLLFPSASSA